MARTKAQEKARADTIAQFQAHAQYHGQPTEGIEEDVDWLHRQETTLHRIAENECNGWPREVTEIRDGKKYLFSVEDEEWRERDQKTESRKMEAVRKLCDAYHLPVEFNGDPRGGIIRLRFVSGASNNWGGIDWVLNW